MPSKISGHILKFIENLEDMSATTDRSFLVANYSKPGQCNIIYCSDGFCRLAGYSRAEVMQRSASCSFLCGPLTSQQAVNGLREALQKGVEKHAEVLYYRKDGIQSGFDCDDEDEEMPINMQSAQSGDYGFEFVPNTGEEDRDEDETEHNQKENLSLVQTDVQKIGNVK
ncbi:unnamed protein product [Ceutorhynchus assimilis]|uniref:PAS domain-containing protein n=1 Tax=Ceutorhynchus assimilis TaxID=467358 RepID=A0A9N9QRN8_9CUCU|nr:unnamed protein product [Ceutorhynchus assimilis]